MVEFLQSARSPAVVRGPTPDQDQRAAVHPRTRDCTQRVGDSWACGDGSKPGDSAELPDGFRSEDSGLLVSNIQQRQTAPAFGRLGRICRPHRVGTAHGRVEQRKDMGPG